MIAIRSGRNAAAKAPNMINSTMSATMIPNWSLLDCVPPVLITPPENSTSAPARRRGPATRSSAAFVFVVSLSTATAKCRSANAIRPFFDRVALVVIEAGVLTDWGTSSASFNVGASNFAKRGSRNVCPAGAATTIRAVAPPVPGNVFARRSSARWDSVPGTVNAEFVEPFNAPAATPTATRRQTQKPATSRRRR